MSHNPYLVLKQYNLILIRFNEIWLKSRVVKQRMLKVLINNIKTVFDRLGIKYTKYQLSRDSNRILFFFKNEVIPQAIEILKNIFGIHSFSPALRTSTLKKNIYEKMIEIANEILEENDSFALRVRRSGKHDYSSQDIAREGGRIILDHFSNLNLKVNLSNPDKKIFIEIRNDFTYIYTGIVKSKFGGLPIEREKRIMVMDIGRLEDILAGFLLMRRGAYIYPILFTLTNDLPSIKIMISNWKKTIKYFPTNKIILRKIDLVNILKFISKNLSENKYICGLCRIIRFLIISKLLNDENYKINEKIKAISDGVSFNKSNRCNDNVDLESLSCTYLFSPHPYFTPIIGLSRKDIEIWLSKISPELKYTNYCMFKPKKQEFQIQKIMELFQSLKLNEKINECLQTIEEIDLLH
ncbi:MAG: THUMP domain-containing protein [Promethearchaeota archaeon]